MSPHNPTTNLPVKFTIAKPAPDPGRRLDRPPVSVRGIRPIVREPVLTPEEMAAVPSDKRTIEPLLTLEQEIALMAQRLTGDPR